MTKRPFDPLDDAILDNVRSALLAGTATANMISDAYRIVEPFDHEPQDACILEAAVEAGVMQESFLDRPPATDAEILASARAALAAGHAPFDLLQRAFDIVSLPPYDEANDDLLVASAEVEMLRRSHAGEPETTRFGPLGQLVHYVGAAKNRLYWAEMNPTDHLERVLQHLARQGDYGTISWNGVYGDFRKKAMRRKWIVNTRQTTGIGDCQNRPEWYYEMTQAGRDALAAFEARLAADSAVPA